MKPQRASGGSWFLSLQRLYLLPKLALSRRGALGLTMLSISLLLLGGDKREIICLNLLCAVMWVIAATHHLPGSRCSPGAEGWYYNIFKWFNDSIENVINVQLT